MNNTGYEARFCALPIFLILVLLELLSCLDYSDLPLVGYIAHNTVSLHDHDYAIYEDNC